MPSDYRKITEENKHEYGHGTKHIEILAKLYRDTTHFIYELLQNAEDAEATSVSFRLEDDRLEVSHDGIAFSEEDVRAISQIADGTKGQSDLTTIGRFGIGFKSVYAYTDVPQVHSTGDITRSRDEEHFLIRDYICPDACPAKALQPGKTTLFVLPFQGNERPDPDNAVSEIANRLRNLDVRTMLFLKHIAHIEWSISGTGEYGAYLRETEQWGRVCPRESLNKGVNSEFDFSKVILKQPSPGSQPEIRNFTPKTAEFR